MEENTIAKVNWKSIIAQVVLTVIISGALTKFIYWIDLEDLRANISDSTHIANEYYTSLSFISFDKSTLKDISFYINDDIDVIEVIGDSRITKNGNSIIINQITPKGKISCIVKTKSKIEEGSILSDSDKKIGIIHNDNKQNTILIIQTIGIFTLMYVINIYTIEKLNNKKNIKFIKKYDEINKELDLLNKKQDKHEERANEVQKKVNRMHVYYQNRISDLNEELDFWKNTIRKIMYNSKEQFTTSENVIETVTNELKTYTTREKGKYNIEELLYLADRISDNTK